LPAGPARASWRYAPATKPPPPPGLRPRR
jgi:hypothetical protein